MKMHPYTSRFPEQELAAKKFDAVENSGINRNARKLRTGRITPISQEVMEYYEKLLQEHNQYGARHSRAEYRIF